MKTRAVVIVVIVLAASAALWARVRRQPSSTSQHPSAHVAEPPQHAPGETPEMEIPESAPPLLDVDHFMRNVDSFPGAVRVKGVVAAVDADRGVLALIDLAEFEACGDTTCAALSLPVRWSKPMPAVTDTVVVTGAVADSDGKLVFTAVGLDLVSDNRETPG